jgi:hypothetical protein
MKPYMASSGIRPMLAKIAINKWWLVACDSFRLIRTEIPDWKDYLDTPVYPDVDTFMQTDVEWVSITKFMRTFCVRLGIFWTNTAIRDGNMIFAPGKVIIRPNFVFDNSDSAALSIDIEHPFQHTSVNIWYFLQMIQPFKKEIDKGLCYIEYRQKNPLTIVQFRIISNLWSYEIGIMPRKI